MPYRQNRLLAALNAQEQEQLGLTVHDVPLEGLLYDHGDPLPFVYFPITAVIALVMPDQNGRLVEIAAVGNEGLVGVSALFGNLRGMGRALVQLPGKVARVPAETLETLLAKNGHWRGMLFRYADAFVNEIARTVACHALHSAAARCARWLLTLSDRARRTELTVNQESLADVLGLRRQTVGIALATFKRARLVHKRRGFLSLQDPEALQRQACGCYAEIRDHFKRLLDR